MKPKGLILFAALALFMQSCVLHKNMIYMNDKLETSKSFNQAFSDTFKVRAHDNLMINIQTQANNISGITDENTNPYGGIQQNALQSTLFYKGYLVDRDGDLNLPLIGKTKAEGRTILELETLLTEKLKEFYKYPFVSVKFASFQVTVLGEVAMPGVHQVYNKHLNLFQAVAMAGDMTSLANRNKVRIIREYGDKTETHYLDFTAPDLIDSEFYFLQPNDVIYVEPSRLKAFNVNTRITNVILSLVSIGLVVVNLTTR